MSNKCAGDGGDGEAARAGLGHTRGRGTIQDDGVPRDDVGGMVDVLLKQAKRDEEIIERMRKAIEHDDRDAVFALAKELTNGQA